LENKKSCSIELYQILFPPLKTLRSGKQADPAARYKLTSGRTLTQKEVNQQKVKAEAKAALKLEKDENKGKKGKNKTPAIIAPELSSQARNLQIGASSKGMQSLIVIGYKLTE
jgi:hypothetical protein